MLEASFFHFYKIKSDELLKQFVHDYFVYSTDKKEVVKKNRMNEEIAMAIMCFILIDFFSYIL